MSAKLEPSRVERIFLAARNTEDARRHLIEAMKAVDASDTRALHIDIAEIVRKVDDLRSILTEHGPDA